MVLISVAPKTSNSDTKSNKRDDLKIIIVFFKIHHILFGIDFGFFMFRSNKIKVIAKFLSIAQCLMYCFSCLRSIYYPNVHKRFYWYTIVIIRYVCSVAVLSLSKRDATFCNLFHDLEIVDQGLNVDPGSLNIDVKIVLAAIFSLSYRVTVRYAYCVVTGSCVLTVYNKLLLIFILESADFVLITFTFVFYSIYCRLRKLITVLETTNCDIVSLHRIYKTLMDVTDKQKSAFDLIFVLTALLCNVPEAMATIYSSVMGLLRKETMQQSLAELCVDYVSVTAPLSLIFAPALHAGMLTAQANKIKVELYNKLIIQRDETSIRGIERFIRYVGARGCRFRVWQVIPLDASLIRMVIGFCVTYLIVIIQFTHV